MGMIKEFKEFAMRGNLVDIAVAFVMGGAFGKVVTSFTEGLVAPLVGLLTGGQDFSEKKIILKSAVAQVLDQAGKEVIPASTEVALKWGAFLTSVIDFIIVAFVMFLIIKGINGMKKKEVAAPAPGPSSTDKLLMEIRDSLKK
jgi:large conductance mechanosensitive channel